MKTLYIIRGLPGSGKSTLGESGIAVKSYSADDWFTDKEGNYNFNPMELPQAHEDCQARVLGAMLSEYETIAVCNTSSASGLGSSRRGAPLISRAHILG